VAVRLVIDDSIGEPEPVGPAASAPAPSTAQRPAASASNRPAPPPPPEPPAPSGPPPIRITPELVEELKKSPLVGSIMDKFNATAVKVEQQQT
jgi:hypothetical protein